LADRNAPAYYSGGGRERPPPPALRWRYLLQGEGRGLEPRLPLRGYLSLGARDTAGVSCSREAVRLVTARLDAGFALGISGTAA